MQQKANALLDTIVLVVHQVQHQIMVLYFQTSHTVVFALLVSSVQLALNVLTSILVKMVLIATEQGLKGKTSALTATLADLVQEKV